MSATVATDTAARAIPYSTRSFAAFRVSGGQTSRLALPATGTLSTALDAAKLACLHREQLVIRETDQETGAVTLHVYTIRRSAPKWVHPAGETRPRRVTDHYADLVCSINGAVLS